MEESVIKPLMDHIDRRFRAEDPDVEKKLKETANVETIKAIYRCFIKGDFEGVCPHMTDDVEMEIVGPDNAPLVGKSKGCSEVAAAIKNNFAALNDQQPEILGVIAQGDSVVILGRETGVLCETRIPYETEWTHWFTLRDHKVRRIRETAEFSSLIKACASETA